MGQSGQCLVHKPPALITAWEKGYKFLSSHFMKMEDAFRENPYYQTWTLSPEHITIIKKSAPTIQAKGNAIANTLYKKLFSRHEMFKQMFPEEHTMSGKMVTALPTALYDFAKNCDNIDAMESTISRIARRHVTQGVQDWHYPMLAQCFVEAFSESLGSDATPAVVEAWTEGLKLFANQIMKIEDLKRSSVSMSSI